MWGLAEKKERKGKGKNEESYREEQILRKRREKKHSWKQQLLEYPNDENILLVADS